MMLFAADRGRRPPGPGNPAPMRLLPYWSPTKRPATRWWGTAWRWRSAGATEAAELGLVAATRLCPNAAASWRELAGLRLRSRAGRKRATWRSPPFVSRTGRGCVADPRSQSIPVGRRDGGARRVEPHGPTAHRHHDIHGADRTRQPVVVRAAGLQPREVLTSEALRRALRRLRDLPGASSARVTYEPVDGGLASSTCSSTSARWRQPGGVRSRSWRARAPGPRRAGRRGRSPGGGELASAAWRWSPGGARVARPGDAVPPGLQESFRSTVVERQSYDATPSAEAATLVRRGASPRRAAAGRLVDELAPWQTGAASTTCGVRRFRSGPPGLARLSVCGRHAPRASGRRPPRLGGIRRLVTPLSGGNRFGAGNLLAAWRTTGMRACRLVRGDRDVGRQRRSAAGSLAGRGHRPGTQRVAPRAPLLSDGVLTGPVFGRDVAHASLEYTRPVSSRVRAVSPLPGSSTPRGVVPAERSRHVTALRRRRGWCASEWAGPGGAIRIDIAHGFGAGAPRSQRAGAERGAGRSQFRVLLRQRGAIGLAMLARVRLGRRAVAVPRGVSAFTERRADAHLACGRCAPSAARR